MQGFFRRPPVPPAASQPEQQYAIPVPREPALDDVAYFTTRYVELGSKRAIWSIHLLLSIGEGSVKHHRGKGGCVDLVIWISIKCNQEEGENLANPINGCSLA